MPDRNLAVVEDLEFRVLGPLTVIREGAEVMLPRRRQRQVLARLVLDAGRVVPAERLLTEIWGDSLASNRTGPVRTNVWELRALIEPSGYKKGTRGAGEVLVSRDAGYLLAVDHDQIDSARFERQLAGARAQAASGKLDLAIAGLDGSLSLWRGQAFSNLPGDMGLQAESARLEQLLLAARELRAKLLLTTGEHVQVAAELEALTRANPERERLWALLMTALYRSGRQGDALRCYQQARANLIAALGVEPGPELRGLEQAVLCQDPALDWRPPSRPSPAPLSARRTATEPADPGRHNSFPPPFTSLVGRGAERAAVARALASSRLVTLTGAGGCGKTRLALAVAEDVLSQFPGGLWFVGLASLPGPDLLAGALPGSLGGEAGWASRPGSGPALLVLDSCERMVDAAAECAERLLVRCPALRILATSREELRLGAELVWRVHGLSLPSAKDQAAVLASEAVQLFIERVSFAPTGEALAAVAGICRRLDGLPLAIELAAALAGSLPVTGIAERLDDRLRLLTRGRRQSAPRHQSVRATLDWSFDFLDEPAQALFAALGTFSGTFTLPAAEAVAADAADPLAVAHGLDRLVRASMVDCLAGSDGVQRYRLLETLRLYACDQLERRGGVEGARRRHALCYMGFAIEAERHVHGPAAPTWLAGVVAELPNLRAALKWAMAHDDLAVGAHLAGSLHWFSSRMMQLDEIRPWLEALARRAATLPDDLQLKVVTAAAMVAFRRGEHVRARGLSEQGIALARKLGEAHRLARALILRGAAATCAGDLAEAEADFTEAQALCRRLGDLWGRAWMLTGRAAVSCGQGRPGDAREQLEEALAIFRSLDDLHGQVSPLALLALTTLGQGEPRRALELARQAARIADDMENHDAQHTSLGVLGMVELASGNAEGARELLLRSIRDFPRSRTHLVLLGALECLAVLAALAGHFDHYAALAGFTRQLHDRLRFPFAASWWERVLDYWLEVASAGIGSNQVDLELSRGRKMDLDQAIALAEVATQRFSGSEDTLSEGFERR